MHLITKTPRLPRHTRRRSPCNMLQLHREHIFSCTYLPLKFTEDTSPFVQHWRRFSTEVCFEKSNGRLKNSPVPRFSLSGRDILKTDVFRRARSRMLALPLVPVLCTINLTHILLGTPGYACSAPCKYVEVEMWRVARNVSAMRHRGLLPHRWIILAPTTVSSGLLFG